MTEDIQSVAHFAELMKLHKAEREEYFNKWRAREQEYYRSGQKKKKAMREEQYNKKLTDWTSQRIDPRIIRSNIRIKMQLK